MREIVFDLCIIATIQFGALAYGIYATYTQRPVAIVLLDDYVVPSIVEHYGGKLEDVDELAKYSGEKPPIIYAEMPRDSDALAEMSRIKIEEKALENAQLQLYRPQSELKRALQVRQFRFRSLLEQRDKYPSFRHWLVENGLSEEQVLIAGFSGRYGVAWLVFDLEGKYLSYFF